MKHSIKFKLMIVLFTMLSFTMLLCFVINLTFLEKYYEKYKIDKLGETYTNVYKTYKEEDIEDLTLVYEQFSSKQNVSMYIFNSFEYTYGILLEVRFPTKMTERQNEYLRDSVARYMDKSNSKEGISELVSNSKYTIYKRYDTRLEVNYIELYGKLSGGDYIFIRSNYDNIKESVEVSNLFFIYAGIFSLILGIFIMYIVGESFTRPILKLLQITKQISNLNFDVRYDENRNDEVGELGRSINKLSKKLEKTISSLKSANNELQNDIHKIEKSEEMRKEFLSNVTHELKTPIALIQGYAEGLRDNINDDLESREFYCDVIIDEAKRMNSLVKKLLSLNEIEFGESKPNFERFNITDLISEILNSMNMLIKQKEIRVKFAIDKPVYVWADAYLVEEVIINYISNAINHAEVDKLGEKLIVVDIKNEIDKVRISVFNTGNPIKEEDLTKIWDKFYKVDKARTREYGGSGVGLSIVKAIMNSLNREFGVKNWDNGVEFWFELDIKS